jgi:uncharacterized protein
MRSLVPLRWRSFIGAAVLSLAAVLPVQALDIPPFTDWVVDRARLLSPSALAQLTEQLRAHEQKTGNQVAVLTLPSLEGESIEEAAQRVFVQWGLGKKGIDNGVLLLVVPKERKIRIHVGYGLEGALTDVMASRIIRYEIVPHFRAGDFSGGVTAGVQAILQAIQGEYRASELPQKKAADQTDMAAQVFLAVLVGTVVGLLFSRRHRAVGPVLGSGVSLLVAPWVIPAGIAAALTLLVTTLVNSSASIPLRGTRRHRGFDDGLWYSTHGGGWGTGGFGGMSSGSGGFSGGGGGDSGGGGASGDW